jgi:hypothetical protein
MDFREKFKTIIWIVVLVIIIGTILNVPTNITDLIVNLLLSIGIGIIISGICGSIIEALPGGEFLKKIAINIEIKGINFSVTISLFTIAVILLRMYLF